jgi:hypothetical protein
MADEEYLTGTFYGGDLDPLNGPEIPGIFLSLPIHGRRKEETGARVYTDWHGLTSTVQYTKQQIAGLYREGEELEAGYQIPLVFGPSVGGEAIMQSFQPTVRWSGLQNQFRGPKQFPSPSVWWNWTKLDYGIRIGFAKHADLTIERAKHHIASPTKLNLGETLATLRIRI